jgi:hypothetical protein
VIVLISSREEEGILVAATAEFQLPTAAANINAILLSLSLSDSGNDGEREGDAQKPQMLQHSSSPLFRAGFFRVGFDVLALPARAAGAESDAGPPGSMEQGVSGNTAVARSCQRFIDATRRGRR